MLRDLLSETTVERVGTVDGATRTLDTLAATVDTLREDVAPVAALARRSLPYYWNLALTYGASALGSSVILEAARYQAGQPIQHDGVLVAWNTGLAVAFSFLERYHNIGAAKLSRSRLSSFLLGPVGLAFSFTFVKYGILGPGLDSGAGTLTGIVVGGALGFLSSWRAWYLTRQGREVGVETMFVEPVRDYLRSISKA